MSMPLTLLSASRSHISRASRLSGLWVEIRRSRRCFRVGRAQTTDKWLLSLATPLDFKVAPTKRIWLSMGMCDPSSITVSLNRPRSYMRPRSTTSFGTRQTPHGGARRGRHAVGLRGAARVAPRSRPNRCAWYRREVASADAASGRFHSRRARNSAVGSPILSPLYVDDSAYRKLLQGWRRPAVTRSGR